jgi:hypothetical protein
MVFQILTYGNGIWIRRKTKLGQNSRSCIEMDTIKNEYFRTEYSNTAYSLEENKFQNRLNI